MNNKSSEEQAASTDEMQTHPYNPEFTKVERVLCTSNIYPLLHPNYRQKIASPWIYECLTVLEVLVNLRKERTNIGIAFSAFAP